MSKLTRVTSKVFGGSATATGDDPNIAQFGSAKAGTFIGTTDVATIQSLSAWDNGFIDAVTPDLQYPALPEFTGLMKVLSYQSAYNQQMGIAEWDSNTTYYTNSLCQHNGEIFKSTIDDNQNIEPTDIKGDWVKPFDGQWVNKILTMNINQNVGSYTFDLTDYLPSDGYDYEILIEVRGNSAVSSQMWVGTDCLEDRVWAIWCSANSQSQTSIFTMPAKTSVTIVNQGTKFSISTIGRIHCYRRIGANE